jgi:hypothetical protein
MDTQLPWSCTSSTVYCQTKASKRTEISGSWTRVAKITFMRQSALFSWNYRKQWRSPSCRVLNAGASETSTRDLPVNPYSSVCWNHMFGG